MSTLQAWITATLSIFQVEFTLYGFTFSFWDVFIWSLIATIVIAFLGGLFNGT